MTNNIKYYLKKNKNDIFSMNNKIYNKKFTHGILLASVSDPYSLNPDPAKNLNFDPSYFLTISEIFFFITS